MIVFVHVDRLDGIGAVVGGTGHDVQVVVIVHVADENGSDLVVLAVNDMARPCASFSVGVLPLCKIVIVGAADNIGVAVRRRAAGT